MAFSDAQRLYGLGHCKNKVNNLYLQYILFVSILLQRLTEFF